MRRFASFLTLLFVLQAAATMSRPPRFPTNEGKATVTLFRLSRNLVKEDGLP